MKTVIAYTLLVLGVPLFLGIVLGGMISGPVTRLAPASYKSRVRACSMIFQGIASTILALWMFHLFGLIAGLSIPIIIALWIGMYFKQVREIIDYPAGLAWCSYVIGIAIAWVCRSVIPI